MAELGAFMLSFDTKSLSDAALAIIAASFFVLIRQKRYSG